MIYIKYKLNPYRINLLSGLEYTLSTVGLTALHAQYQPTNIIIKYE